MYVNFSKSRALGLALVCQALSNSISPREKDRISHINACEHGLTDPKLLTISPNAKAKRSPRYRPCICTLAGADIFFASSFDPLKASYQDKVHVIMFRGLSSASTNSSTASSSEASSQHSLRCGQAN